VNRSKQRGTAFETRVVKYLQERGFVNAERRALAGTLDKGDITGLPGVVIECKNVKAIDLAGWMDETLAEQKNARASVAFCVFPRRNRHIGQAYVLITFDQMLELIAFLNESA